MLFKNLNRRRQAKPGAKALRCKERFENFWNLLLGNARPVVGNIDLDAPPALPRNNADLGSLGLEFLRIVAFADHRFGGIADEVDKHPAQPAGIKGG